MLHSLARGLLHRLLVCSQDKEAGIPHTERDPKGEIKEEATVLFMRSSGRPHTIVVGTFYLKRVTKVSSHSQGGESEPAIQK